VWAAGDHISSGPDHTLIEHWNGTKWSVMSSPNKGTGDNYFFAVTAVPSSKLAWAAGSGSNKTLIEHIC
jgi:hypothetical protein